MLQLARFSCRRTCVSLRSRVVRFHVRTREVMSSLSALPEMTVRKIWRRLFPLVCSKHRIAYWFVFGTESALPAVANATPSPAPALIRRIFSWIHSQFRRGRRWQAPRVGRESPKVRNNYLGNRTGPHAPERVGQRRVATAVEIAVVLVRCLSCAT